ncbi:MAG: SPOR domain-containing protein [Gemmatimonadaceae bacterium]|nr:SPOR domain-containing protein [Gemmatimonadaceae bacterium]
MTRGRKAITVIDRFAESIATRVELPDEPSALRMDADGRYLLARSARGDSTRIIAIGTSRLVGTVRTLWRDDLPFVAPDGSIALAQGGDLVVVDGETRGEQRRVVGGAEDLWYLVRWNGFRPRAASLDEPVRFEEDSIIGDSSAAEPPAIGPESPPTEPAPAARAPVTAPPAAPAAPARERDRGFVAAFAPMSTEARARALANLLRSGGNDARVVPVTGEQAQLWRVLVGPFRTRTDADRAGRQSGFPYVIAPVDP